jgi:hypothetical protein
MTLPVPSDRIAPHTPLTQPAAAIVIGALRMSALPHPFDGDSMLIKRETAGYAKTKHRLCAPIAPLLGRAAV